MSEKKTTKIRINSYTENDENISIEIEGDSSMPFWNHDLKFEAILALLGTIDEKDFAEDGIHEVYGEYQNKVLKSLGIYF